MCLIICDCEALFSLTNKDIGGFLKEMTFPKIKNRGIMYLLIWLCSVVLASCAAVEDLNYGILIDAGSSSSKIKIYDWNRPSSRSSLPVINLINTTKFEPGIATLSQNAAQLGEYVDSMLKWAANTIPKSKQPNTPVLILATAGMRYLKHRDSQKVMAMIRDILSDSTRSPFAAVEKNDVSVLSGEEEGAYAWIAVNYLNGFFRKGKSNKDSVGIMEMGGASTQIAFIPDGSIYDGEFHITLASTRYSIYVHSYLSFGSKELEKEVAYSLYKKEESTTLNSPCMLKDDSHTMTLEDGQEIVLQGAGDGQACKNLVESILAPETGMDCQPKPCVIRDVYQPPLSKGMFYATQAFTYAPEALGAVYSDKILDLKTLTERAGEHCQMELNEAQKVRPERKKYLSSDCLTGMYIPTLFQHYGFNLNTTRIKLTSNINSQRIDWALGAMLIKLSDRFSEEKGAFGVVCPSKDNNGGGSLTNSNVLLTAMTLVLELVWFGLTGTIGGGSL